MNVYLKTNYRKIVAPIVMFAMILTLALVLGEIEPSANDKAQAENVTQVYSQCDDEYKENGGTGTCIDNKTVSIQKDNEYARTTSQAFKNLPDGETVEITIDNSKNDVGLLLAIYEDVNAGEDAIHCINRDKDGMPLPVEQGYWTIWSNANINMDTLPNCMNAVPGNSVGVFQVKKEVTHASRNVNGLYVRAISFDALSHSTLLKKAADEAGVSTKEIEDFESYVDEYVVKKIKVLNSDVRFSRICSLVPTTLIYGAGVITGALLGKMFLHLGWNSQVAGAGGGALVAAAIITTIVTLVMAFADQFPSNQVSQKVATDINIKYTTGRPISVANERITDSLTDTELRGLATISAIESSNNLLKNSKGERSYISNSQFGNDVKNPGIASALNYDVAGDGVEVKSIANEGVDLANSGVFINQTAKENVLTQEVKVSQSGEFSFDANVQGDANTGTLITLYRGKCDTIGTNSQEVIGDEMYIDELQGEKFKALANDTLCVESWTPGVQRARLLGFSLENGASEDTVSANEYVSPKRLAAKARANETAKKSKVTPLAAAISSASAPISGKVLLKEFSLTKVS